MEMSNDYMPELHVAQQRRRDKLRVQQLEDLQGNSFHHNLATSSNSGLNNNLSMVYPTEMLNFTASHSSAFHNIHPSRFVAPSSSDSCEPVPLQSCHNWIPSYDESHVDNGRRNFLVPQFSVHNHNNAPTTDEISATHHYLNSGHHNWESSGNELALLPSFVSQPNDPRALPHGLSLSLSSNQIREMQCLDEHESRDLKPLESGSVSSVVKLDCGNNNSSAQDFVGRSIHMYRNVGPLGPFTGYTTILKSSKYLKPAQQLLDEFFSAAGLRSSRRCEEVESMPSSSSADHSIVLASKYHVSDDLSSGIRASELYTPDCHEKKSKLLHMQEEVCKRHKQYHQQMEMVILAFKSVPGLSNATPYISRSLKTISRHFRSLKSAIADQLKLLKRALGEDLSSPTSFMKGDSSSFRLEHSLAIAKSGTGTSGHQNHIWRPQRGLPERAVSILRAWLFDHFLHPYPTDTDKQMLAGQTGLSRNQVSNWFINARVRLWKPMVEEIHMLETKSIGCSEPNLNNRQGAENQSGCKQAINAVCDAKPLDCLPSSSYIEGSRGEMNTTQFFQKCSRMESHQIPNSMDGSFISCLPYQRQGLELGGMGAVSLTLGLRHGSETTQHLQDQFQQQGMQHFGGHVMHNFSG